MWSQVVLIKVVHYCIKIIVKLVRPKFDIHRYHFLSLEVPQPTGPHARALAVRSAYLAGLRVRRARPKKPYLRMSNFDLTFCKVYIYAKGWPGINLGASHESCAHPTIYKVSIFTRFVFIHFVCNLFIWMEALLEEGKLVSHHEGLCLLLTDNNPCR